MLGFSLASLGINKINLLVASFSSQSNVKHHNNYSLPTQHNIFWLKLLFVVFFFINYPLEINSFYLIKVISASNYCKLCDQRQGERFYLEGHCYQQQVTWMMMKGDSSLHCYMRCSLHYGWLYDVVVCPCLPPSSRYHQMARWRWPMAAQCPSLVSVAANIWIWPTGLSPLKTLGESDVNSCVVPHSSVTTSPGSS